MKRIIAISSLILISFSITAQNRVVKKTKDNKTICYHYHCDNVNVPYPCTESIHLQSKESIKDTRVLTGKLSYKLNGQYYECIENTVRCHTTMSNFLTIYITGKISDSSQIVLSYRVQLKHPVGKNVTSASFTNLGNYSIQINNIAYNNFWKIDDTPTEFDIKVNCAYKYGYSYLLNGSFNGILKDKQGNVVNITEGKFCSDKINN
jgi:hypothetical protein